MNYQVDLDKLKKEIQQLSFEQQLLFGYLCSERLLPNYRFFSVLNNWGNYLILETILEKVKAVSIGTISPDIISIQKDIAIIYEVTPDMDDFGDTIYGSHALDASMSVICLLEFLRSKDLKEIFELIDYVIETVRMNIRHNENVEIDDKEIDAKINNHPFIKREISLQTQQYYRIKSEKGINDNFINELLALQFNNNKSNVDIG